MMPRAQHLHASFLWPDLGWLTLRLAPTPCGGWQVFASTNSGPWTGTWVVRQGLRHDLALWMATLEPQDARRLVCAHPPIAHALQE